MNTVNIFEHLGEAYSGTGRDQLTNAQKDGFLEPLAAAVGSPREHLDIRALSDEKQTRRSLSESTFSRVQLDVETLDWIFLGRCTGDATTYPKILKYMSENVQILAGIAIFVGAQPNWHVIGIYYDSEMAGKAYDAAQLLGFDFDNAIEVRVRDRRNLTKNLSDQDDPLTSDVFLADTTRSELISELMRKKCIAVQGPPGTGKTVIAKSIALEVARQEDRILTLQFHQSYSYEDFVKGWRPTVNGNLELKDGAFLQFCDTVRSDLGNPYVVLIDEINRANISQVFGEVLSLIEATKRDSKFAVNLAYDGSNNSFYVPKNVFLIATMNTADRSLALVDFALRRRFSFVDLEPAFGTTEFHNFIGSNGIDLAHAKQISKRMIELNDIIKSDSRNLGRGYEVGHSYFCGKLPNNTSIGGWYQNIIEHEIGPLLREYWADEEAMADERISVLSSELDTSIHGSSE